MGDFDYYNRLYEILGREETARHFLTYLKRRDIRRFNPAILPKTEEKAELMEENRIEDEKGKTTYFIEVSMRK